MTIQFCGAAREVTGSSHLITLNDGFKILLDCGLYQGGEDSMENFNQEWMFNPSEIGTLIVSHAHIDHTGRIPKLVKDGFRGVIHSTHATRDLCGFMLLDSAKIQEGDAAYKNKRHPERDPVSPLYTTQDVYQAIKLFASYPYEQWFEVHPGVRVIYRDAGHILGSASVFLEITEKGETTRVAFTGDIGRPNRPILKDPQPMMDADVVICESTYGNRDHLSAPSELHELAKIILHTCVEKRGKLIIPAFSIGRTQEIVYMMDQLVQAGLIPNIPVYVDSPLAINATQVFLGHPECFDSEMHQYMLKDSNPFGFNSLRYVRDKEESKRLNTMRKPCVIISASGMMNAGRIQHHLFNNIENSKNTFLIVGYCSPNTPGGKLRAGEKEIRVFGQTKTVKAEVVTMDSFSAHGDRGEMADFLENQKKTAKKIYLVHGTLDRMEPFRDFLKEKGFTKQEVIIPILGETVSI